MIAQFSALVSQWSSLEWQWPYAFILLPLPILVRLFAPQKSREPDAIRVPFFTELESLQAETSSAGNLRWLSAIACVLIWCLLIIAAARPTTIGEPVPLPQEGRDLMLAVDISRSMEERDMRVRGGFASRVVAVKAVVGEFISKRTTDRLGLILFGEHAYLQTPLTFDRQTVRIQLEEAQLGFAGNATAIGEAIGISIKRMRDRAADSRVLILLTDGANTAGPDPRAATEIAKEANIRIHTVGIGSERQDFFGRPSSNLDEDLLVHIAETTGGNYFRARNPAELQSIYDFIDQLEPAPEELTFRPQKSLFHVPLIGAVVLAILGLAGWLIPSIGRRLLA